MIVSSNFLWCSCSIIRMGEYPYLYHKDAFYSIPQEDLLMTIIGQTTIIKYSLRYYMEIIEQDLYKLRKIYESNKKY